MKLHLAALLIVPFLMGTGGCASEPPEPTIVVRNVEVEPPAECLVPDPAWKNPPADGERAASTSRREQENKRAFNAMRAERSVCRAGLKATETPDFKG
ncbi:hypothetical protein Hden_1243 [Hyphomicrobium denitrificans ATCC 51888]|uniref:Lipoprotein n=1 Tax=Hyphomicrobium denitrificans (strain ATCC 51888 / DSM 1869 / NCIMB 11706 / TK 0415) TaxID=582899 RepID=D8JWE2_HYPDA|nr:hypothetical protein [Hyphomicrobium denitrificans]ADJ23055.1 hypothetical protein Hden_1243 [Hyphomicrobium denitrificans ATCC 51888]